MSRREPLPLQLVGPACLALGLVANGGCATTGPAVTSAELTQAQAWLEAKAVRFKYEQLLRVNRLGYQLVAQIPESSSPPSSQIQEQSSAKQYPYVGWLLAHITKDVAKAYGLHDRKGVVIVGVIPNSPAEQVGLQAGDVLKTLNGTGVPFQHKVIGVTKHLAPGDTLQVELTRLGQSQSFSLTVDVVPRNIMFQMTEEEAVNAYAQPGGAIGVTYGLMRFVHSDDELAVVLGHELAHLTKGHLMKSLGTGLMAGLVGGTLGGLVEIFAPGLGSPLANTVSGAIQAQFSKDLEREADFVGLQYVHLAGFNVQAGQTVWERFAVEIPRSMVGYFLSTHPPSPERMVRLQKAAYALLHDISLEQLDAVSIPLQLDPLLASELAQPVVDPSQHPSNNTP